MKLVSQSDLTSALEGGHRFVVNMIAEGDQPAEVRSCEVIGTHHRNRFSFPSKVAVSDVFIDQVAHGVLHCLASLSNTTEVVSLPTVTIEIPGLSLAKAHLITTLADDGSLGIILRFKVVLGSVNHAFRPELGIESSVADYSSHMSALVLTDIVMPFLDLCTAAENGVLETAEGLDTFVEMLMERSQDVRFQSELIKRFVASAADVTSPDTKRLAKRPKIELVSRR
ncbi:hypothetical protein [Pseudooctadecabacter jejudonensis]|uniref:Uncharacterized protein n=1 Tax=Pseudooctadecabacter jejudonensis TaxID=1391910 RepID=A0A1Y5T8R4_9RHOB|nr:hypothetical protein [Pseudooctadecabacter jejudonensis]SLN58123.1 hypothetical protein PSJ8397_03045 [Pseudooctadecabacter jejudonensis]